MADDNIKIYEDFKLSDTIKLPQRPTTFDFGGEKRKNLIVTTRHAVQLSCHKDLQLLILEGRREKILL
ncbi:hypothetical protein DXA21_20965 [Parabacteroides distasonis]|nr:hypothetical protein DXA21_20965 [Parabacteroides distasonis]